MLDSLRGIMCFSSLRLGRIFIFIFIGEVYDELHCILVIFEQLHIPLLILDLVELIEIVTLVPLRDVVSAIRPQLHNHAWILRVFKGDRAGSHGVHLESVKQPKRL
ncbi:hypothetical protein NS212_07560 [Pseudomonas parafulva]|nr:hypothetical protein NS212_07560 [Pseudomonas parafulva]